MNKAKLNKNTIYFGKGQKLYKKAKKIIPAGTQLLSKRPELYLPGLWPSYYSKAKGCEVWDLDENRFIDMSYMGIGACVLGYADKQVDNAVKQIIDLGVATTLNAPEEIDLANLILDIHPWANMIRYAKTGGEAMAIAVRIARAYTGKDKILFCGYHGWHDWYLSSNLADDKALDGHLLPGLEPKGVPRALKGSAIPFEYNDVKTFTELIKKHKNQLAAVVMEPVRGNLPKKDFLETIRKKTRQLNIVLIIDEISAGFRMNVGGAHLKFNIAPDIAVFSKGVGNGYPIAFVIGTKKVMRMAQDTFISSTNWTERTGLVAALATIKTFQKYKVHKHIMQKARDVQKGWGVLAKKHKLEIQVSGLPPFGHFSFEYENPLVLKTLFTQVMLEKGFLATTAFYGSYAHKGKHVNKYLKAVDETFKFIKKVIDDGNPDKYLLGEVSHTKFKRLA